VDVIRLRRLLATEIHIRTKSCKRGHENAYDRRLLAMGHTMCVYYCTAARHDELLYWFEGKELERADKWGRESVTICGSSNGGYI
jgi:hypothetical protein